MIGRRSVMLAPVALAAVGCGDTRSVPTPRTPSIITYGDDPSQFVELWRPTGEPLGVVVVIHGGFWKAAYDASLGRPLARDLASRGYAALNIEYRRVGSATGGSGGYPATFDDVSAAIDTLADVPGLDLTRVIAMGHSAGGHLAVWSAARHAQAPWAAARVPVTGVVSQAGVLDLDAAYASNAGDGAVLALMGSAPGPASQEYADADPTRQLPLRVPVRCVHGDADDVVLLSQSEDYVSRASAAGADATLAVVSGDHFVVIDPSSPAWQVQLDLLDGLVS